jgi:hypothetical protein
MGNNNLHTKSPFIKPNLTIPYLTNSVNNRQPYYQIIEFIIRILIHLKSFQI